MDEFLTYESAFNTLMGRKSHPNESEIQLFERTQKYVQSLRWIPWIAMIAVVNSLAMYATHEDSDIDLFVITAPNSMWLVRLCMTAQFFLLWVWRKWDAVRGNFCLSFFITTDAMNLQEIAIEKDVYLYYWIRALKPILTRGGIYETFLEKNNWVSVTLEQRKENLHYRIFHWEKFTYSSWLFTILDHCIRVFLLPLTRSTARKKWNPKGIILSENMLKFHDQDRRETIRSAILNTVTR